MSSCFHQSLFWFKVVQFVSRQWSHLAPIWGCLVPEKVELLPHLPRWKISLKQLDVSIFYCVIIMAPRQNPIRLKKNEKKRLWILQYCPLEMYWDLTSVVVGLEILKCSGDISITFSQLFHILSHKSFFFFNTINLALILRINRLKR